MPRVFFASKSESKFTFTFKEFYNYLISIAFLTIIFTIASSGGFYMFVFIFYGMYSLQTFLQILWISFLSIITAFVAHETAHKLTANYLGSYARYRMSLKGLLIGLATSFLLIVIVIPGGVEINEGFGKVLNKNETSKVAAAGPIINEIFAGIFLSITLIWFFIYGTMPSLLLNLLYINAYLGFFNIVFPVMPFDGYYVYTENLKLWVITTICGGILLSTSILLLFF